MITNRYNNTQKKGLFGKIADFYLRKSLYRNFFIHCDILYFRYNTYHIILHVTRIINANL